MEPRIWSLFAVCEDAYCFLRESCLLKFDGPMATRQGEELTASRPRLVRMHAVLAYLFTIPRTKVPYHNHR